DRLRARTRAAPAVPASVRGGALMVVGNVRRARVILGTRFLVLGLGAFVLMIPFLYMLSTSFKPNTVVLEIPPQLVPHHPTTANYSDAWTSNRFGRYF